MHRSQPRSIPAPPFFRHGLLGQSIVELALVLPILALILMGTLDLGRVFYTHVTITNASRVGAEFAMDPRRTQSEVREIVKSEARPYLILSDSDIMFTTPGWASGNDLIVEVNTPFTAVTPFISSLWGGGQLTLRARTTTRFNVL